MGAGTGVLPTYLPNKKNFFETTDSLLHYCRLMTNIGCRNLTDRLEVLTMAKKPAPKQAPKAAPKGGKKK